MGAKEDIEVIPKNRDDLLREAFCRGIESCITPSQFKEIRGLIEDYERAGVFTSETEDIVELAYCKRVTSVVAERLSRMNDVNEAREYFRVVPLQSIWSLALLRKVIDLATCYSDLEGVYAVIVEEDNYLLFMLVTDAMDDLDER